MNQLPIKTAPFAPGPLPDRVWLAITCSLLVHLGVIAAAISLPQPSQRWAAVRSGRATVELQASAAAPDSTHPLQIEPVRTESQTLAETAPAETTPPPEITPRTPDHRSRPIDTFARQPSERPLPPPSTSPAIKPPSTVADPSPESLASRRALPDPTPPTVREPTERQPVARPPRRKPQLPPATASIVVPAATNTGAARETPTPVASNRPPQYPAEAAARGIEGTTLLRATVHDAGHVTRIEVEHSSGSSLLDQAAMSAVAMWQFEPQPASFRGGVQTVLIPVEFKLHR